MRRRNWPIRLGLCAALTWASLAGAAEPSPSGAVSADAVSNGPADGAAKVGMIDPAAHASLMRMAGTLARAKGLGFTIDADFDVVQETGETVTYGERRSIALVRPDRLLVDSRQDDGKRTVVSFDGAAITVFDPQENVYGRYDLAGSVDDAVRELVQALDVRVPLALLLVTTLPEELGQRLVSLVSVGRDVLSAVPADHLVGRTADVDFQVWIPTEGPALPRRVIITYRTEDGRPQFRADLSDWTLEPDASATAFALPAGVERIPFLLRVRRAAATPTESRSADGAPK